MPLSPIQLARRILTGGRPCSWALNRLAVAVSSDTRALAKTADVSRSVECRYSYPYEEARTRFRSSGGSARGNGICTIAPRLPDLIGIRIAKYIEHTRRNLHRASAI